MNDVVHKAIAVVGVGALLPDAPDAATFWENVKSGRYSVTETPKERWDPNLYFDEDPAAPDKTYSKIGGWVREFDFDPFAWRLPLPPKVSDAMDRTQKWSIIAAREALADYGYPDRPMDPDRTAVILGNAMAGDQHYLTAVRIMFPEYAVELAAAPAFAALPAELQTEITDQLREGIRRRLPDITEDTMPGELGNIIAGRVANLFDFHGPNYTVDAACASAMAAMTSAIEGLEEYDYDVAISGGIDANMSAASFIKFCKIGALSATGTRPYADGADGFVMGEGAAVFILKRLEDAERDGDNIYAVVRGLGAASDGKGKGITAPNPIGQQLAVKRAWIHAGLDPATVGLMEGHGTSTRVGDVVEVQSLTHVFGAVGLPAKSVPLGSVKSNIGHLKGGAGSAGILKAVFALRDKVIPPSINFERPNPNIGWDDSPFYVPTEAAAWRVNGKGVRNAGVSAFGFGGTNFHAVLEEYVPGHIKNERRAHTATKMPVLRDKLDAGPRAPLRGALVVGGSSIAEVARRLEMARDDAVGGVAPEPAAPLESDLRAAHRVAIDYGDAAELARKAEAALKALEAGQPAMWKALSPRGIFYGSGEAPMVAFLYTGQGSQYVNMVRDLRDVEPIVADAYRDADEFMTPLLDGKRLSDFIFVDATDDESLAAAEKALLQTEITQPAVLATDEALTRLLSAYGIRPDMVMGHSLGEYAALVSAGALPFSDALDAVSARGKEMAGLKVEDHGRMSAVFGPLEEIERIVTESEGYVVVANFNSTGQAVIGGASDAVEDAGRAMADAGMHVVPLLVSHAFHTEIVAPASEPLKVVLDRLALDTPAMPVVANLTGEFYPMGPNVVPGMIDILGKQVASPVQFVKGLRTLYDAGARVFVEVGPKRALSALADDVLGDHDDVVSLFTNHPKHGGVVSFNQALCGLYAAGYADGTTEAGTARPAGTSVEPMVRSAPEPAVAGAPPVAAPAAPDTITALGELFAEFLERGYQVYKGGPAPATGSQHVPGPNIAKPVAITGAALGLPGTPKVFDDENLERILEGEVMVDVIPVRFRREMVDKSITRLMKTEQGASFETIESVADVIKLAGRPGAFDLAAEFGFPADRIAALDTSTQLAIAAGLDALRDAGIPLVMQYKTTTTGSQLPDRWMLPESLRDDTAVVFASAFPGADSLVDELDRFYHDRERKARLDDLRTLRTRALAHGDTGMIEEIDHHIHEIEHHLELEPYSFDRRFLFKVLSMGHSQFAEYIGARGPNTQINSACASTTQAVSLAEDWITQGRARRVVIISADNVTSDSMMGWVGSGFLATGAAATDEAVEDAVIPFDKRRHGLVIGMGAAALVVEDAAAAAERGLTPICEVLSTVSANSAFHGTRLDVNHIRFVMNQVVDHAEQRWGIDRSKIASETVFVSHETYTPARGGSAQAEVDALRFTFGDFADHIVVANTKGFTGHAMATGIEDVVAVKALETGIVPPVPNLKEPDPDLGFLNLSQGGTHSVEYALRLGAGFGSQVSLSLTRRVAPPNGRRPEIDEVGYRYRLFDPVLFDDWVARVSGREGAKLEVAKRTLRVVDEAAPSRHAAATESATAPSPREIATPTAAAVSAAPVVDPVVGAPPVVEAAGEVVGAVGVGDSLSEVESAVLGVVAEQTGYPPDMLEMDLDLEADLGIDTVKQAETFAAIRERYGIERDENLALRDFPTLAHVVGFVMDRRPDLAAAVSAAPVVDPVVGAPPVVEAAGEVVGAVGVGDSLSEVESAVLGVVAEQTGYPPDMLEMDLDLEADLGIDTVKQAETFAAIRERYGIERDENLALRDFPTLAHVVGFVMDRRPDLAAAVSAAPVVDPVVGAPPVVEAAGEVVGAVGVGDSLSEVESAVLGVVAEQTGYPPDMLEMDLDLEADLGIDTVKQAETFAAIRERYGIERDENLALRDFPTLAHVVGFVMDRRPDLAAAVSAAPVVDPVVGAPPVVEAAGEVVGAVGVGDSLSEVESAVLGVVAEQTGYPPDMLEMDLDLEADLGIDTVKQAETFAAIRERYGIERDENLALRDFPTLAHVVGFVMDRRPDLAAAVSAAPVVDPVVGAPPVAETAAPAEEAAIGEGAVPRRVPRAVIRPALEVCAPTGVELGEGSRVVVFLDSGGVGASLVSRLEKLDVEALVIDDALSAKDLEARLASWLAAGPITGVYWLPALDGIGDLGALDFDGWKEALRIRVKLLYTTMRTLYESVGEAGTFLVTGTRLGGRHGYDEAGAVNPLGGAVTGFAKTYKRERPGVTVKAVDFPASRKTAALASLLIAETLADPGVVEVGYADDRRWSVALVEEPAEDGQAGIDLGADTVFVVTGAAGSITSAITADLAQASGGTFHLLDMTPEPDPADPDLIAYAADRDTLKKDIFARLKVSTDRATPAMVDRELASLERLNAALEAIRAVEAAGGTAYYHNVDLLDHDGVAGVMERIRETSGRVDVLLHAGGLEISHLLPDKPPEQFDLVFDVKANGWFSLINAMGDMPLGATVAFSSIAGRFGNAGQADYSAANDLLCKLASHMKSTHTRGIAVDWTAWADIGMATRGSIPTIMERAGIDMLPAAAGIPFIRKELTSGGRSGEVFVGLGLGILTDEWDERGGLAEGALAADGAGPMLGEVTAWSPHRGFVVETTLDPTRQPFLDDHRIDGTPVLPGVMGMEAFAEAAALPFSEMSVSSVEDVDFLAPFKFYRDEPRKLTVESQFYADGEDIIATCRLLGSRLLPGNDQPQVTVHFTGSVRLAPEPPKPNSADTPEPGRPAVATDDIYSIYFHGPAYQVLESAWRSDGVVVGAMPSDLPPNDADKAQLSISPRLIELCFQTAGIWEMGTDGRLGLPRHVGRVAIGGDAPTGKVFAVVELADGGYRARVVDEAGRVHVELDGYRTIQLPGMIDSDLIDPLRKAIAHRE